MTKSGVSATREKRPQDWTAAEQLAALQENHCLSGEALQAWCRQRGIFAHHLTSWKTAFCTEVNASATNVREVRSLKDEIAKLKRDVVRKDRALTECGRIADPEKKFRALWEAEE